VSETQDTLASVLADPTRRRAVIDDSVQLIEDEVHGKGGLSGMALKAGYRAVKAIKPGVIHASVDMLLPDFAPAVDPFYVKAKASGDVRRYFVANADAIADALLGVTDRRAERAKQELMKKTYGGLRPMAKRHTAEAVPRLADLIAKHVK
jgi:hypothetical protein